MNSMGLSCLFFSHILPLATTEMLLVETYNDTMHAMAPKTKPNETDQKSVGSNEEVGHLKRRLEVGQDYSSRGGGEWLNWDPALMEASELRHHGCWKCRWKRSPYCKWVAIVAIVPSLKLSYTLPILTLMLYTCTHADTDIF